MGLSGQVSDSVVSPWHWWGPGQVLDLDLVPVPQVTEQEDQVPHSLKVPRIKCKIAIAILFFTLENSRVFFQE